MSKKPSYTELEQRIKELESKLEAMRGRSDEAFRESEGKFRLLAESIQDVFWMSTPGITKMLYVSPTYEQLWGRSCESLYQSPRSFAEAVHPDDRGRVSKEMQKHAKGSWGPIEYRIVRPDGSVRWIMDRGFPTKDHEGRLILTGVASDITERKRMEKRLEYQALHDPLTGLYNRSVLKQRLDDELNRASRYGHAVSVFMVDADYFKRINDNHGHDIGDIVLRELALILQDSIRSADYAARYGGEEFAVVLPETSASEAEKLGERLRNRISEHRFSAREGETLQVTVSIGISTFPDHAKSPSTLLRLADEAMYEGKRAGRDRVVTSNSLSPNR